MFEFIFQAIGGFFSSMGFAIVGILIVVLLAFIAAKAYKKSPPDEVMVITGLGQKKFVIGNSTFVVPFLQRADKLNLGTVQALLRTDNPIPTSDAILIDVQAVANFQISTDPALLEKAARNYLNQEKSKMMQDVSEVLMGKMREVIGQMEIVELMRNRDQFNKKVFENAQDDMMALGLELVTFNVQDFQDREDVIKNMGADQSNEIRKAAQFARIQADQEVAIRQNELDLKNAELKKTADRARAEADMVFSTVTAERTRELKIAEQEAEIAAETKRIELKEREVAVKERELEATVKKQAEAERYAEEQRAEAKLYTEQKQAEAKLYTAKQEAEAVKATAQAEAQKIEALGRAEGEAEKARGTGLAEATKEQIAAYNEMINANFLADRYISLLPEITRAAAEPLTAVDNITMYGDGNAAKLVEETSLITSQVNAGLADTLGFSLKDIIGGITVGNAAGSAFGAKASQVNTNNTDGNHAKKPSKKPAVKSDQDSQKKAKSTAKAKNNAEDPLERFQLDYEELGELVERRKANTSENTSD